MQRIPLSKPSITASETQRVGSVLASGRLALGPELEEFERRMAEVSGTDFAVATNSGTSALHISLLGLGVERGDEIITTPFSFVASSNAALFCDASPVFVDIEATTYNIDTSLIESVITDASRGIIGVDVFGAPANWPQIERIARHNNLIVVDDACEALGATLADQKIGSFGDAACFGYYPNKQITTGEGGCVTTNSHELASVMRSLRNQGRADSAVMNHVRLGYNYRMSELSAALGNAQLERLPQLLQQRRSRAQYYSELLAQHCADVSAPSELSHGRRSWFVYVVELEKKFSRRDRDVIMDGLRTNGIECSPYFPCIHLQPYYVERFGYRRGMFPVAESVSDRTIALPFFPDLKDEGQERVVECLINEISDITARSRVTVKAPAAQKQF